MPRLHNVGHRLALCSLCIDITGERLPHGYTLDPVAVRRIDHRAGLRLGLRIIEDGSAVGGSIIVRQAERRNPILISVAEIAPKDPTASAFALVTLIAEMDAVGRQGLPVRLASGLQSCSGFGEFEVRMFNGLRQRDSSSRAKR